MVTDNPHSQIFGIAIQLGLVGAALCWRCGSRMRSLPHRGLDRWIGTVVVVENVVSSLAHSHLFDFMRGWLYVFGVGVTGGMVQRQSPAAPARNPASRQ